MCGCEYEWEREREREREEKNSKKWCFCLNCRSCYQIIANLAESHKLTMMKFMKNMCGCESE
jgi:hypothetical protein